jgi:hypothetical protein
VSPSTSGIRVPSDPGLDEYDNIALVLLPCLFQREEMGPNGGG